MFQACLRLFHRGVRPSGLPAAVADRLLQAGNVVVSDHAFIEATHGCLDTGQIPVLDPPWWGTADAEISLRLLSLSPPPPLPGRDSGVVKTFRLFKLGVE